MPRKSTIDHDGLHKQLLTGFFQQFLEGFFPEVAEQLDFTDFGPEIFRYFALLHIKFGTMVIPIVLYGDGSRKPLTERWTRYEMNFAGHRFLDFRFLAVHPSSMPVRDFLNSHNPAQLALAARMDLGNEDMVRIKLDLLRQLAKLRLTGEQIEQALHYVDAYLEETEPGALQRELATMNQAEYREAGMLIEHFTNLGLAKGLEQGKAEGLEQGIRTSKLEDARKMREHGIEWAIVTDVTGLKPEDLESP